MRNAEAATEVLDAADDADATAALMSGFDTADDPTATPGQKREESRDDKGQQAGTEEQASTEAETQAEKPPEYAQITTEELAALRAGAALSAELKATLEKVQGTAFGKIGGIERQLKELAQVRTAGKRLNFTSEQIEQYRNDGFPELADVLEAVQDGIGGAASPAAPDHDELAGQIAPKVTQQVEQRLLAREHPDWQQIDQSPEWVAYVKALPQDRLNSLVQASEDFDSSVISREMSAFKKARDDAAAASAKAAKDAQANSATARKDRLYGGQTPRGNGGVQATGTTPEDEFLAGFTGKG